MLVRLIEVSGWVLTLCDGPIGYPLTPFAHSCDARRLLSAGTAPGEGWEKAAGERVAGGEKRQGSERKQVSPSLFNRDDGTGVVESGSRGSKVDGLASEGGLQARELSGFGDRC